MTFHRIPQKSKRQLAEAQADADRIRIAVNSAVLFTTTILKDRRYMTISSASLAEARSKCAALEQAANNHRKAMVYAVTPDRFTHFIPEYFTI